MLRRVKDIIEYYWKWKDVVSPPFFGCHFPYWQKKGSFARQALVNAMTEDPPDSIVGTHLRSRQARANVLAIDTKPWTGSSSRGDEKIRERKARRGEVDFAAIEPQVPFFCRAPVRPLRLLSVSRV